MDSAGKQARLRRFEESCRQRGLSLTVQRRTILKAALDQTDHPTADQIYIRVRAALPDVSRTTVYRVLDVLVEIGAIARVFSPGAAARFDPVTEQHHHLVCVRCERIIDLPDDAFRHRVQPPPGPLRSFVVQDFSIYFRGTCAACRKRVSSRRGARPRPGDPARRRAAGGGKSAPRGKGR